MVNIAAPTNTDKALRIKKIVPTNNTELAGIIVCNTIVIKTPIEDKTNPSGNPTTKKQTVKVKVQIAKLLMLVRSKFFW